MSSNMRFYQMSIFSTLFVGFSVYVLNRKCVALALPQLISEGLDVNQAGLIMSGHNVAYAISKFFGGVLSDRVSSRLMFSLGLALCGMVTLVFATVSSSSLFVLMWFLNGLGQGGGWPACSKMLRQWFPPTQFGTWWSVLASSSNIAGGLSPFLSTFLIVNYGWRTSLLCSGLISLGLGVLSLMILIDSPSDVGLTQFSKKSERNAKDVGAGDMRAVDLLWSRPLWLVSFCFMGAFCVKTSVGVWGQLFLLEDKKQTPYAVSIFMSSVEWGGFLGRIFAGYVTDLAVNLKQKSKVDTTRGNARMPLALYFNILCVVSLHFLQFMTTEDSSIIWMSIIGFILGVGLFGPIAIYGVVATELAPSHLSGTCHAIAALAANVGAVLSGLPFSSIAKYYQWSAVFILLEVLMIMAVAIMFLCRNLDYSMGKKKTK